MSHEPSAPVPAPAAVVLAQKNRPTWSAAGGSLGAASPVPWQPAAARAAITVAVGVSERIGSRSAKLPPQAAVRGAPATLGARARGISVTFWFPHS